MVEVLAQPDIASVPQPTDGVTYAKKIDKAEAHIDFARPATDVRNHIHGLSPFPGAWFSVNGARVKVLSCSLAEGTGAPGTFLDDALTVACGEGAIHLLKLQREGKGAMEADAFLRGFAIASGTVAS
jgi:methionyl-tRNA formyltransferase